MSYIYNQESIFHLTRMRIKECENHTVLNLLSDIPLENHLPKRSVSNSMIVHSTTINFFTGAVKNYNSDLNFHMFIERIVCYHITNILKPVCMF